jgi:hypothetical protein
MLCDQIGVTQDYVQDGLIMLSVAIVGIDTDCCKLFSHLHWSIADGPLVGQMDNGFHKHSCIGVSRMSTLSGKYLTLALCVHTSQNRPLACRASADRATKRKR